MPDVRRAEPGDVWLHDGIYYEVQPEDSPNPCEGFGPLWAKGWVTDGQWCTVNDITFLEREGTYISTSSR
jgi:hypothetical protein